MIGQLGTMQSVTTFGVRLLRSQWQRCARISTTATANVSSQMAPSGGGSGVLDAPLKIALGKIKGQHPHLYAKILIHSFPFTVSQTDLIATHWIKDTQVGDVLTLDEVREVGSPDYKLCGLPLLPKGSVQVRATVVEHTRGAKTRARMRKQRKGRRALRTIKPLMTVLRIQEIVVSAADEPSPTPIAAAATAQK